MTKIHYPERTYLLSDTYGGHPTWNPFESLDIDALITTDIRSRLQGVLREFDIFGAENITDHILRAVVNLYEKNHNTCTTGIFINSAPRIKNGQNGEPFYLAEAGDVLRIVATPLEVLSAIRSKIKRLYHLPNRNSGLYGPSEQFRSSYTPKLLAAGHSLKLIEDDTSIIPEYEKKLHLAYIDRFGNLVLYAPDKNINTQIGQTFRVNINAIERKVKLGDSLAQSDPGALSVYKNDGNIEIVAKWDSAWSPRERLKYSAYGQFKKPKIGSRASITLFAAGEHKHYKINPPQAETISAIINPHGKANPRDRS